MNFFGKRERETGVITSAEDYVLAPSEATVIATRTEVVVPRGYIAIITGLNHLDVTVRTQIRDSEDDVSEIILDVQNASDKQKRVRVGEALALVAVVRAIPPETRLARGRKLLVDVCQQ